MQTNLPSSPWFSQSCEFRSCYPIPVPVASRRNSRVANKSWRRAGGMEKELEPLWDDGYGSQTVRDYMEAAKIMIKSDGGPPRWFCPVESGPPIRDSPLLLYLPGIDGVGMGMVLHHKALGKVFQVRCMHVPVYDRTPYEALVKFVENAVKAEHASFPSNPIYLVGESFGGCLALSVAAANPKIDLVLILVNPATSFERSHLQPLLPFLDVIPGALLPLILGTTSGDPIKMANVINATKSFNAPSKQIENLIHEVSSIATEFSNLAGMLPKQTVAWKLKLLKSGAKSSNTRLHAIKNDVLILASGKDLMLPSKDEAQRLSDLLDNSRVRFFKDNGHLLLMEDGINLLTVLKGNQMYRRSRRRNSVADFLPPSMSEFRDAFDERLGWFRLAVSPVMMSILPDGKIVRGLGGVPDEGPVLLVGYHMLLGVEIGSIVEEFLREKNVTLRGLAHPWIFGKKMEHDLQETSSFDYFKVFGAIPVSPTNLSRLLSSKSHALLYPGGVREALHGRGGEYKLQWPEKPEFVRMAVKYGAKIVPFGVVGEDDLIELYLDYNDQMKIPFIRDMIRISNDEMGRVESEQALYFPCFYPKLPGRFYFLFGQPIETVGREELLTDRVKLKEFYVQVKTQVERNMAYLVNKREEDPCRHFLDRLLYRTLSAPAHHIPTFDPSTPPNNK